MLIIGEKLLGRGGIWELLVLFLQFYTKLDAVLKIKSTNNKESFIHSILSLEMTERYQWEFNGNQT